MFIVAVTFTIHNDKVNLFREKIVRQAKDSLQYEENCHQFDICTNIEKPNTFFLYEVYTNEECFNVHLNAQHFKKFDTETTTWVTNKDVATWVLI